MAGHFRGTSPRDLPATNEKYRELNPRSALVPPTSARVSLPTAQGPAYRPAHPLSIALREARRDRRCSTDCTPAVLDVWEKGYLSCPLGS
jgi:hypothetical protein